MKGALNLVAGFATEVTLAASKAVLDAISAKLPSALATDRLKVDGSGVTQPVSGTVAVSNLPGTQPVSGAVAVSNFPATQAISAAALPLPSDASTATLQNTLNTNITNLRGQITATLGQAARAVSLSVGLSTEDAAKVPSLGQALAAASVPVVLTAIQIAQLLQAGQLPAALGMALAAASLSTVRSVPSIDPQPTLATAGKVIKAGPAIAYGLTYYNNTGGAVFLQVFNSLALPTTGDRPVYFSASIANTVKSSLGFGPVGLGQGCPTGFTFAVSSTQDTFTAQASTAFIYAIQYD